MDSNSNEKIKTKIIDAFKGVKEEDRINFLINRLANSEQENERLKIDVETKKKENAKIPMVCQFFRVIPRGRSWAQIINYLGSLKIFRRWIMKVTVPPSH